MAKTQSIEKSIENLKSSDKFRLIEVLIKSLDRPNEDIAKIWSEEAEKRLKAYKSGKLGVVSEEDVYEALK